MAYILGFAITDGGVHGKTLSWDLSNKDPSHRKLLERINAAMDSNYPIACRKASFRLRISQPIILQDIAKLGVHPKKSKTVLLPNVPENLFRHFARGVLDGDGWVSARHRNNHTEFNVGFSSGSSQFLSTFIRQLQLAAGCSRWTIRAKVKTTPSGFVSTCYQMDFFGSDAEKIVLYLYNNLNKDDLWLERKQQRANMVLEQFRKRRSLESIRSWRGTRSQLMAALEGSGSILPPRQVAKRLGVSLATVYRWMNKMSVRKNVPRGSIEWKKRIIEGRKRYRNS